MNIGITGASGFIGQSIAGLATRQGHHVVGFSRNPERRIAGCAQTRLFSPEEKLDLSGCQAVVHLAGENVFGLWTADKRKRILESRRSTTRRVVDAMLNSSTPPKVLVCASAIGYYGDTGECETNESAPPGGGFLSEVTQIWEEEAERAAGQGIRVVKLRISIVLGRQGGALQRMLPIFRLGLGGRLGDGQQWVSWIHQGDLSRLALFAIEDPRVEGILNACAPEPVRNQELTNDLAKVLHRPALFPVPAILLRSVLGEFSRELLDSKRVVPKRALDYGFKFQYPTLETALNEVVGR